MADSPQSIASILVVDDEPSLRYLLRRQLKSDGYTLYEAENGEQALAMVEQYQPDIVLLDILMPGMDGIETCTRLQALPSVKRPLVLMLTALDDPKSVDRAFEAGAVGFVNKPVHLAVMRQRIPPLLRIKRAGDAPAQERNLLQTLIDHLPDYIYIKDTAGRYLVANAEIIRNFGATAQADVLGKTDFDFHPRELAAQYIASEQAILESGQPLLNWEEPGINLATGEDTCLLTSKIPLHDHRGKIIGLVGVKRDISESKAIERKLVEYHSQLEKLVEDRTTELTTANQSLHLEIAERKRIDHELERRVEFEKLIATISTHFIDLTPNAIDKGITHALRTIGEYVGVDRTYVYQLSADRTMLEKTHEWCDSSVSPESGSMEMLSVDSVPTWMEMLAYFENVHVSAGSREYPPDTGESKFLRSRNIQSLLAVPMIYCGHLIGFLGFDSVQEKKAWEKNVSTLLRMAGETFVNALQRKRTEEALYKSEEQLRPLTDNMLDIICQTDPDGIVEYASPSCWSVLGYSPEEIIGQSIYAWVHPEDVDMVPEAGQPIARVAYRYLHSSVAYVWMETLTNFLFGEAHAIKGHILSSRDITERKRAERELQELNRLKTEFLSTAAHELRTPLTSIRGFSEILLTRQLDDARQKRYVTLINEQSTHLGRIIDDLLDISRLEAKRELTLSRELVNIADLIDQVMSPFVEAAPTHQMRVEGLDNCPPIFGDPFRLSQVCKNLLSNAVKYSPKGGTITVRSRLLEGFVEISVQDQGMGMTPEQQEHLFEKFYRADGSNLAISR